MNWYRSWPEVVPDGRAHVVDSLPRIVMSDCDYLTAKLPADEPGFCLLEWDIALDRASRQRFAERAARQPELVLVAPYRIRHGNGTDVIAHRDSRGHWIGDNASWAVSVGFGCIYLPRKLVNEFLATRPDRFTDSIFSRWHHEAGYGPVPIAWDVHPQHLHGD